jgi:hypothetical protein
VPHRATRWHIRFRDDEDLAIARELADERARGNATYAEVEESEADLERYRTWSGKIAARDYFEAPPTTPPSPSTSASDESAIRVCPGNPRMLEADG